MPWTLKDVDEHNKGLTREEKEQWVEVANSVRKECLDSGGDVGECDASAVRQANSVVAESSNLIKKYVPSINEFEEAGEYEKDDLEKELQVALKKKKLKDQALSKTRSGEFVKWFEGSKITYSTGQPMVVYAEPDVGVSFVKNGLIRKKNEEGLETGFYFTIQKKKALDEDGNSFPCFIKITNPFVISDGDVNSGEYNDLLLTSDEISKLETDGYDGVVLMSNPETEGVYHPRRFLVFSLKNVKHVMNKGGFDSDSPNVFS